MTEIRHDVCQNRHQVPGIRHDVPEMTHDVCQKHSLPEMRELRAIARKTTTEADAGRRRPRLRLWVHPRTRRSKGRSSQKKSSHTPPVPAVTVKRRVMS